MRKEFVDAIIDIAPIIFIVSVASSFLKGARTFMEYIKALIASYIVGIPGAFLTEYLFPAPEGQMLKYVVVLTLGTGGICIFNGMFKIFKAFEERPSEVVDEISKRFGK